MAEVFWGEGLFSPYSQITEIKVSPVLFFTTPANSNGVGWGSPFVGQDGGALPMGTSGGPGQVKALTRGKGGWGYNAQPGTQQFGNIDWRGPPYVTRTDPADPSTTQKLPLVITYHGPQLRYFPDKEDGYTADKSQYVYHHGKIMCVAPHPVLGAGAKEVAYTDPEGREHTEWRLYVICRMGLDDRVYEYLANFGGWSLGAITSEVVASMHSLFHRENNPLGYKEVTSLPKQAFTGTEGTEVAKAARTPWFFNESCTEAACMREMEITHKDNNGEEYTEDKLSKYTLGIGTSEDGGFEFTYGGNLERLQHRVRHGYYHFILPEYMGAGTADLPRGTGLPPCRYILITWRCGDWIWDTDYDASWWASPGSFNTHEYHVTLKLMLQHHREAEGAQLIAVDYDKDVQINARLDIQAKRWHRQEYSWGVDFDYEWVSCGTGPSWMDCTPGGGSNLYSPSCGHSSGTTGKPTARYRGDPDYGSIKPLDPPYFSDGNHHQPWPVQETDYVLQFTNSDGDKEYTVYHEFLGTEYQVANKGQYKDEYDRYLGKYVYTKRYAHFMDLRHPFIVSYTELEMDASINMEWPATTQPRYEPPKGTISRRLYQREAYVLDSDISVKLTETELLANTDDTEVTGTILGYDWEGKPSTTGPKPNYGGPDWTMSWEVTYDHQEANVFDSCEDVTHLYKTQAYNLLWGTKLDARNSDSSKLEPPVATWYGLLRENGWPLWDSFFGKASYEDNAQAPLGLCYVQGGLATNGTDWVLSYTAPPPCNAPDQGAEEEQHINLITEEEALTIFPEGDRLYPVATY